MSLISVNDNDKKTAVLEIGVDAVKFEKAVTAVFDRKKVNITLPGFRKGKAPRHLVEKMYGKGFLYEDAVNDLIPDAFEDAAKESGLDIVGQPEFDIKSIDENGLVITAKVTLKPEVEIADYKGITLKKGSTEVTDEEIDAEIASVRERNSRNIEVTDRPAKTGDLVTIDFEGFNDGVAFDGGKAEGQELKLGSGQFIPGFEENIVGHSIGDAFDIDVTFPAEYHAKELAGKPVVFKIVLHAIKEVELPTIDDEFAKDVSEFDTLDEYKADIKAKLVEKKTKQVDAEVDDAMVDALCEKLRGEIPDCMIDHETDEMLNQYDNRLKSQGLDLDTYLKYTQSTIENLRQSVRGDAEKRVKSRLALEKISVLEGITVSDEEVAEEIAKIAKAYGMEAEKVESLVNKDDIASDVKVQKAAIFVKDNANYEA